MALSARLGASVTSPDPFRYDTEIGADAKDSHGAMLGLIGRDKRVLEVGCSTGAMTRVLVDHGCSVVGIEFDPITADKAREFAERVIVGDVEILDLRAEVGDDRFDVVVFGDVLEHLRDPVSVLRQSAALLAADGSVVISLPNVAHGDVRLSLLHGQFRYRPVGLLDATHLRFFTSDSLVEFLRDSGFVPLTVQRLQIGIFDTELELDPADFDPELVAEVEADPEALTYQFVVKAVPAEADGPLSMMHERAEAARAEALMLRQRVGELEHVCGELVHEVDLLRVEIAGTGIERDDLFAELARRRAWRLHPASVALVVRRSRVTKPFRRAYRKVRPRRQT